MLVLYLYIYKLFITEQARSDFPRLDRYYTFGTGVSDGARARGVHDAFLLPRSHAGGVTCRGQYA